MKQGGFSPGTHGHMRLLALLILTVTSGCYARDAPPYLDVDLVIPDLSRGAPSMGGSEQQDAMDAALDAVLGEGESKEEQAQASLRQIPIGAGLMAELPESTGQWNWAHDGDSSLVVHSAGDWVDVVIYTQKFRQTYTRRPSKELGRFLGDVDPMLSTANRAAFMAIERIATASDPEYDKGSMVSGLRVVGSRTMGMGFGYSSDPGTFTGWRWYGANRRGTILHLGRTQGIWSGIDAMAAALGDLPAWIREKVPKLEELANNLERARAMAERVESHPPVPSYMVVGQAEIGRTSGVHLSALCASNPSCREAAAISEFLDSIQPGDDTVSKAPGRVDMQRLAEMSGLVLVDPEELMDLDGLKGILDELRGSGSAPSEGGDEAEDASEDAVEPVQQEE